MCRDSTSRPETSRCRFIVHSSYCTMSQSTEEKSRVPTRSGARKISAHSSAFFLANRCDQTCNHKGLLSCADLAQSTYPRLPQEIIDIIIDMLQDDTSALFQLSLVSVGMATTSRHFLYRRLTLYIKMLAVFFRDILNDPQCTFIHHVRELRLISPGTMPVSPSIPGIWENGKLQYGVGWILSLFPNVKILCLDNLPLHRMSQKSRRKLYAGLEGIETLILNNTFNFLSHDLLLDFLQSLPNLRRLAIRYPHFAEYGNISQSYHTRDKTLQPTLKTLVLRQPSTFSLSFWTSMSSLRDIESLSIEMGRIETHNIIGTFLKEIGPSLTHLQLNLDRCPEDPREEVHLLGHRQY